MTSFAVRCIVFGLLWVLGVVAMMVWAMDAAPSTWGCYKLVAAFVVSFVGAVFTYVRDPEKAWSNSPTTTIKP